VLKRHVVGDTFHGCSVSQCDMTALSIQKLCVMPDGF
jgi:hypothetical protein